MHRDLKTENLLLKEAHLTSSSSIKVIDFGISCRVEAGEVLKSTFGTPYYMAPEVIRKNYTEKCDLWSCGVIMFILLTGNPPFKGKNVEEL